MGGWTKRDASRANEQLSTLKHASKEAAWYVSRVCLMFLVQLFSDSPSAFMNVPTVLLFSVLAPQDRGLADPRS